MIKNPSDRIGAITIGCLQNGEPLIVPIINKSPLERIKFMHYGGFNYTTFSGVNVKNGMIRLAGSGAFVGTLTIASTSVGDRAWSFVDKSGKFGITGTANCDFTYSEKGTCYTTAVVVASVTAEDGVVVTINGANTSSGKVLVGATAGAGVINLYWCNLTDATVGRISQTITYTAVK